MSRRVLITGGSGFVGQWLCRTGLERGWTIWAGTIDGAPSPGILSESAIAAIRWIPLDVGSEEQVRAGVESSQPEWCVHLAGIAFPPDANASPARAFDINTLGVSRLLQAIATTVTSGPTRVLVVGSAEQYGAHPAEAYPLPETAVQLPMSTYAASKAAQEVIALQMTRSAGADIVCTRSFNHSGRGHPQSYLLPSLVSRVRALRGAGGTLAMGNLTPVRDYLHVADVVEAYVGLLARGTSGEVYNVASGVGTNVGELARRVLARMGVTADISCDPVLARPSDMPILVGDHTKLRSATGWAPRHSIDDIIDDLIHAAPR
jgi:GDP-4-dehydro-6-deoxy-D-mannose reductase